MHAQLETREEYAYAQLRERILSGALRPGDALREIPLANEIGASRTPVQHAIRRLQRDGLVVHSPGLGAFVKQHDARELEELATVRLALEKLAVELAARHATPGQIVELRGVCDEMHQHAHDARRVAKPDALRELFDLSTAADEKFHRIVLAMSGNETLAKTVREMSLLSRLISRRFPLPTNRVRYFGRQYSQHYRIYQAIRARDGALAASRMEATTSVAGQLADPV